MGMNDAEIERVINDLQHLVGRPFQTLWQPARDRVVLGFGDGTLLLMVPRGPFARIHTVQGRPKNPPKPFSFQGACRARLHGSLTGLSKHIGDRIVTLSFGSARLELRLTGRSGGLWLIEETGGEVRVVAAYDGPAPEALPELPHVDPPGDPPRFDGTDGWDLAARRWFTDLERRNELNELRSRVDAGLRRAIARASRLVENLEQDLANAARAPQIRHQAELLAANLYRAERGASVLQVEDWESGESVSVTLDPSRPASYTLDRLYHQAKRLERVSSHVSSRILGIGQEIQEMSGALAKLDALDRDALKLWEARLPKIGSERQSDEPKPFVTWLGPNGMRVLVGKSAQGNRALTFQSAKGHDYWMHVRERAGAHLVLPVRKGQSPPLEHLLAAAQIALLSAKLAPGEAAEVQYTRARDVRAIPGELGRVTLSGEKVLRVVREPAALAGWAPEITTEPE